MKQILSITVTALLLASTAFAEPIHDMAAKGDNEGVQAELHKNVGVNLRNEWEARRVKK